MLHQVTSRDSVSGLIQHSNTHNVSKNKNPSEQKSGQDNITWNVKRWIFTPIILFHVGGFVMLVVLTGFFLIDEPSSPWVWPAMIAGFTGIPFALASNIKMLINAIPGAN